MLNRSQYEKLVPCTTIALDIGGTKIASALIRYESADDKPTVVSRLQVPTDAARGGECVIHTVAALIDDLMKRTEDPIAAIGVATAGRVDAKDGSINFANDIMPGWTGMPVARRLSEHFGVPVAVLNDVQAHALGELRWGAAMGKQDCIMVAPGTGLGGAIISGGKVLRGARGFAGEFGHTLHPWAANIPCGCGGNSHLESIASGSGIEARYHMLAGKRLSGAEISKAAKDDATARHVIMQAGYALGESIAAWVNMLDPELVILSGSVTKAGPIWHEQLEAGFYAQCPDVDNIVPIVNATLGGDAPLFGAAEHALDMLIGQ